MIVIQPELGPLKAYVGQGKDLTERIPQSVKRLVEKWGDEAVRYIDYLPIKTDGMGEERAKKFIRETSEQFVLNLLRGEGVKTDNSINPVAAATSPARFGKHFKDSAKNGSWISTKRWRKADEQKSGIFQGGQHCC